MAVHYQGEQGVDVYVGPYERWLYGPGKPHAFPAIRQYDTGWLTSLIEWASPVTASVPSGEVMYPTLWKGHDGGFAPHFTPLIRYFDDFNGSDMLAGMAAAAGSIASAEGGAGGAFPRLRVNYPLAPKSLNEGFDPSTAPVFWQKDPETEALLDSRSGNRRLTIVAVIDEGIPFAHRNFRKADGQATRIEYCWLQSARGIQDLPGFPKADSATVLCGAEFCRPQIDWLIDHYGDDEDELYRASGAIDVLPDLGTAINRQVSHGANILDLAAGYAPERDGEPPEDIRIITVQLPNTIAWDTSGFGKDMFMLAAFHYIFERADRIAAEYDLYECPLVVTFSYGFSGGPHNALAGLRSGIELESAIDEMVFHRRQSQPTAICMPAGNTFSDRLHAVIRPEDLAGKGDAFDLFWRVQPNDRTPSFLEIWLPKYAEAADYELRLRSPDGKVDRRLAPDHPSYCCTEADPAVAQLSADFHRGSQWRFLICLGPTEPEASGLAAAPAGKWTVTLTRTGGKPLSDLVRCYIQRDNDPEFFKSGSRQSYFDMPGFSAFKPNGAPDNDDNDGTCGKDYTATRRFGTLNGLATGKTITVVSGYRPGSRHAHEQERGEGPVYSSAGPAGARSNRQQVDLACLSDRGIATPGIIAAGTRSGGFGHIVGTSTAAPQVAWRLSLEFASRDIAVINENASGNYAGLLEGKAPTKETSPETARPNARFGAKFVPPRRPA
jgi:hypothetical protein